MPSADRSRASNRSFRFRVAGAQARVGMGRSTASIRSAVLNRKISFLFLSSTPQPRLRREEGARPFIGPKGRTETIIPGNRLQACRTNANGRSTLRQRPCIVGQPQHEPVDQMTEEASDRSIRHAKRKPSPDRTRRHRRVMDALTMTFAVSDTASIKNIAVGDSCPVPAHADGRRVHNPFIVKRF